MVADDYDLEEFLARVAPHPSERCADCYQMRLEKTAAKAKELGESEFSTTLLISPYQNQELLVKVGLELAEKYGVKFLDDDLRGGYRQSIQMSKDSDLYRQPYCGCIYSEKDRYYKSPKGGKK
jgi:predicted adenine nucleotide alpha hydrolase (AANH) superfamily ATPase